jgi:hypothetical protein
MLSNYSQLHFRTNGAKEPVGLLARQAPLV